MPFPTWKLPPTFSLAGGWVWASVPLVASKSFPGFPQTHIDAKLFLTLP